MEVGPAALPVPLFPVHLTRSVTTARLPALTYPWLTLSGHEGSSPTLSVLYMHQTVHLVPLAGQHQRVPPLAVAQVHVSPGRK